MMRLVSRLILRPLRQDLSRTILTLFSIAIGVAVIFAMDLAGDAAAGSFQSSMETVSGPDDMEITGTGGLPATLLAKLVLLPEPLRFQPRIEDFALLNGKRSVPFVGIDIFGNAMDLADGATTQSTQPADLDLSQRGVYVSQGIGVKKGEMLQLQINDKPLQFKVLGVLEAQGQLSGDVVILDMEDAEAVTGRNGRVDRILVALPAAEKGNVDRWVERLQKEVPPGVSVRPVGARKEENRKMLAAFRWNLRILSYIALMVGAFLIYNTISVSVVRRRGEIGVLRAVGATRGLVTFGFLCEALFFGLAGGVLGLLLGRVLAEGAVKLVGLTVQALYVSSTAAPIHFDLFAAATSLFAGISVSILAALAPAIEAGQVPPTEAMARGRIETQVRESSGWYLWVALGLALLAVGLSFLPPIAGKPLGGYVATLCLVAAASLSAPRVVEMGTKFLGGFAGVESLLAGRSLAGSLRRTSVLVAALASAIAMMTSIGIMVGSFRETMMVWMDTQIRADFYLRPAGEAALDRHPSIGEDISSKIEKIPGVEAVDRFRAYTIRYEGLPATLAAGDVAAQMRYGRAPLKAGDRNEAIRAMQAGEAVLISEPFSEKHHLRVGDRVTLSLGTEKPSFRVGGIYYDYSSENGYVVLDVNILKRYLPLDEPSGLAIYLQPGADRAALKVAIEKSYEGRRIVVFENGSLRREAERIFDQTFAVTYALEAVAIFVAVMGVAGAMLALIIDRRREIGLLRFLGAATGQVRKLVLFEAAYIGLFSQVLGLLCGYLLSFVLIYVINKQSFGWTIQFHLPVAALLGAIAFVYVSTILAGLYPAQVATKLNPIEVMHEE